MTVTQSLLRPLTAIAVAGLLGGCAAAGSAPPTSSSMPLGVSRIQSLASPIEPAKCKKDHGVSVTPCSVSLSASEPTATVTTKGPTGGVFSFNDKTCSAEGIATVSGSGNSYLVTWGDESGSCKVTFTDKVGGKKVGTAKLSVTNSF
jgi:hypothetical protein